VRAVDRLSPRHELVQRLQHQPVTAQGHNDVGGSGVTRDTMPQAVTSRSSFDSPTGKMAGARRNATTSTTMPCR
jgi:hypothetical protein